MANISPGDWVFQDEGSELFISAVDGSSWRSVGEFKANQLGSHPVTEEEAKANCLMAHLAPRLAAMVRKLASM